MTVPTMTARTMNGQRFRTVCQYWRKSTLGAFDSSNASGVPVLPAEFTDALYPTFEVVATERSICCYHVATEIGPRSEADQLRNVGARPARGVNRDLLRRAPAELPGQSPGEGAHPTEPRASEGAEDANRRLGNRSTLVGFVFAAAKTTPATDRRARWSPRSSVRLGSSVEFVQDQRQPQP